MKRKQLCFPGHKRAGLFESVAPNSGFLPSPLSDILISDSNIQYSFYDPMCPLGAFFCRRRGVNRAAIFLINIGRPADGTVVL